MPYTVEPCLIDISQILDTCDTMDTSECPDCISIYRLQLQCIQTPSTADTPLFHITNTFFTVLFEPVQ